MFSPNDICYWAVEDGVPDKLAELLAAGDAQALLGYMRKSIAEYVIKQNEEPEQDHDYTPCRAASGSAGDAAYINGMLGHGS